MKLIKIDGYWVIISDEEIQYKDNGKLVVDEYNKIHHLNENSFWRGRLIIASNKPEHHEGWLSPEKAPYNITFAEEVAKELGEVDIEDNSQIHEWVQEVITEEGRQWNDQDALEPVYYGVVKGYNQCKEDNKEKKYTEEDLMEAFYQGRGKSGGSSHMRTFKYHSFEDYIQSLLKKEYLCTAEFLKDNIKILSIE